jgi:hypothetical protein
MRTLSNPLVNTLNDCANDMGGNGSGTKDTRPKLVVIVRQKDSWIAWL